MFIRVPLVHPDKSRMGLTALSSASPRCCARAACVSASCSPQGSPAREAALLRAERGALDELAQAGHAAGLHVPGCCGRGEPAADQEPDIAAAEDDQELLGHHLERGGEASVSTCVSVYLRGEHTQH